MKLLVVAACLALAPLYVSATLSGLLSNHRSNICKKHILEDWLKLPVPLAFEKKSRISQVDECNRWIGNRNVHFRKFSDCYRDKFYEIHKSISETLVDEAQRKLYWRRSTTDNYCKYLWASEKHLLGEDWWEKLHAQAEPVNEALTLKICAESHLINGEGFEHIPEDFENWPRDNQANFCEERREQSLRLGIEGCEAKLRKYDYLQVYSKEEEKSYDEIKRGYMTCDRFLDSKFDWDKPEPLLEKSVDGESSEKDSKE